MDGNHVCCLSHSVFRLLPVSFRVPVAPTVAAATPLSSFLSVRVRSHLPFVATEIMPIREDGVVSNTSPNQDAEERWIEGGRKQPCRSISPFISPILPHDATLVPSESALVGTSGCTIIPSNSDDTIEAVLHRRLTALPWQTRAALLGLLRAGGDLNTDAMQDFLLHQQGGRLIHICSVHVSSNIPVNHSSNRSTMGNGSAPL